MGAPYKHYISGASSRWHHAREHVDVVIRRATGVIDCQEQHPGKPHAIDSTATENATHVDGCYLVKNRCLITDLRVARPNTIKGVPFSAYKNLAVRVHIERTVHRPVGNTDWTLPGYSAVGRALELHSATATVNAVVRLVLESVTRTVGLVDSKPLLISSSRAAFAGEQCPGLAAIG